jgi:hypothetical protein
MHDGWVLLTNHLQRAILLNSVALGIKFQHVNFGESYSDRVIPQVYKVYYEVTRKATANLLVLLWPISRNGRLAGLRWDSSISMDPDKLCL